ncbi:MAG: hypothetical protein M0R74_14830 [Dehalococcoidia bacterium]|nr:hypothetical protein [Dehalococcoidia bacterium]
MTGTSRPRGLAALRRTLAPFARPIVRTFGGGLGRLRRRRRYMQHGIEGIAGELRTTTNAHAAILREFGAHVGRNCSIHGPLHIVNAGTDFSNLSIGDRVHLGANVLIDLADSVHIEDEATISMNCALITHIDVGPGPLRERRPRETGPVRIASGAYLGAGVTVLHGVTVGKLATAGAHAVLRKDVAPGATVVAPDAIVLEDQI